MRGEIKLSRRAVLAAAGLAAVSVAGCDVFSTDPDKDPLGKAPDGKEAPELASRVKSGDLPPLGDRLPEKPMVVRPVERYGVYGGTWNGVLNGPSDDQVLMRNIGYEHLMRWDLEFSKPIPNVLESVDTSADGREFTLHLRKGMKWSDGEPVTAGDILFAYQDMYVDEEVYDSVPQWLRANDEPAVFTKVDDLTVKVTFAAPNGLFLQKLATADGKDLIVPRHYLQPFHRKYNPDADKLAKERGHADWIEMFNITSTPSAAWSDPERPTLHAWVVTEPLNKGQRVVAKRNPYYWKTDTAGRQLPYIDTVTFDIVGDPQVILLKATNGEIHLDVRHVNTLENKPVLAQHRSTGKYEFFDLPTSFSNQMMISLNLNHKNPMIREIFGNKDFRIGLSHAIKREELIEAVYQGQGEPYQPAPRPESDFYDEEMAKQYTTYDPGEANRRLDAVGLTKRDAENFRLAPDGKRLRIFVEVSTGKGSQDWTDSLELIQGHWKAVGIDMQIRPEDNSLWDQRTKASDHDAAVGFDGGGLRDALLVPRWVFPWDPGAKWAVLWGAWFAGRKPAEEPTGAPRRQMDLYRQMVGEPDDAKRDTIFREILKITKEEFYTIGTVLPKGGYGIRKTNFHNVPKSMPDAGVSYLMPGPSNTAQFFIQD